MVPHSARNDVLFAAAGLQLALGVLRARREAARRGSLLVHVARGDVARILGDPAYRDRLLAHVHDPEIRAQVERRWRARSEADGLILRFGGFAWMRTAGRKRADAAERALPDELPPSFPAIEALVRAHAERTGPAEALAALSASEEAVREAEIVALRGAVRDFEGRFARGRAVAEGAAESPNPVPRRGPASAADAAAPGDDIRFAVAASALLEAAASGRDERTIGAAVAAELKRRVVGVRRPRRLPGPMAEREARRAVLEAAADAGERAGRFAALAVFFDPLERMELARRVLADLHASADLDPDATAVVDLQRRLVRLVRQDPRSGFAAEIRGWAEEPAAKRMGLDAGVLAAGFEATAGRLRVRLALAPPEPPGRPPWAICLEGGGAGAARPSVAPRRGAGGETASPASEAPCRRGASASSSEEIRTREAVSIVEAAPEPAPKPAQARRARLPARAYAAAGRLDRRGFAVVPPAVLKGAQGTLGWDAPPGIGAIPEPHPAPSVGDGVAAPRIGIGSAPAGAGSVGPARAHARCGETAARSRRAFGGRAAAIAGQARRAVPGVRAWIRTPAAGWLRAGCAAGLVAAIWATSSGLRLQIAAHWLAVALGTAWGTAAAAVVAGSAIAGGLLARRLPGRWWLADVACLAGLLLAAPLLDRVETTVAPPVLDLDDETTGGVVRAGGLLVSVVGERVRIDDPNAGPDVRGRAFRAVVPSDHRLLRDGVRARAFIWDWSWHHPHRLAPGFARHQLDYYNRNRRRFGHGDPG